MKANSNKQVKGKARGISIEGLQRLANSSKSESVDELVKKAEITKRSPKNMIKRKNED